MRVLVLNPGSSTLKATVLEPPDLTPRHESTADWGADATALADPTAAVAAAIRDARRAAAVDAVGYRVVHGGSRFSAPVLIDDDVEASIADLVDLAPLHNGIAAAVIRAGRAALPTIPHVAAFDTAFHATLPPEGYRYAIPELWFANWGIRRYGFHGLSVAWATRRAAELLERPLDAIRLVVAHLGSGCSVTAVDGGRSVDTSMGLTPLEGLMMGTRSGSIDPGALLRVHDRHGLSTEELAEALDHRSGLLGVSGRSADVRELLDAERRGDERAALALDLFVRRAAQGIGAAATCLPSLDAVVFTGGIGEHAEALRVRITRRLAVLGVGTKGDAGSGPVTLVVEAREDVVIAEAVVVLAEARATT